MTTQKLLARITTRDEILDGKPSIRGHHLTVEAVLGHLADGATYESLSAQYDWLEPEDIQACLMYAQRLVRCSSPEPLWEDLMAAVPAILEQAPYIQLLVLFGSRARGDASQFSDWDFAFLCDEKQRAEYERDGFSFLRVWGIIQRIYHLGDDQVDVIDLKSCSDALAHYIARDGRVLYECSPGIFKAFQEEKLKTPEQLIHDRDKLREKMRRSLEKMKQATQ